MHSLVRRNVALKLPKGYVDEMARHAAREAPNECCGIVAGKDGQAMKLYPMINTEHSPYRYNMDPRELYQAQREIEGSGWEVMVIYHSHTHSPAYPSRTDVRLALWPDGQAIWPDAYYVLVSLEDPQKPKTRAFRIADGGAITEEELQLALD